MDESAIPPLLAVLGHPIAGNPTQFAMEQALDAAGMDWRFLSFDVTPERLGQAIQGIDSLGFRGASIAPPHCAGAFEIVERHSDSATTARWVDTLTRAPDGSLEGRNLIGEAFVELLGDETLAGANVAIAGDCDKCAALADTLLPHSVAGVAPLGTVSLADVRVLIRGRDARRGSPAEVTEEQIQTLSSDCVVVDLAICAGTSPLLRISDGRNLRVVSMIDLLVARAAKAFRMWTGRDADNARLREAFEEYLEI